MAYIDERLFNIIDRVQSNTELANIVPGTNIFSILEANGYEFSKIENAFNAQVSRNNLLTASGSDLDAIAYNIFGIKRMGAIVPTVSAETKLIKLYTSSSFGSINSGQDIVIAPGDIVMEGATAQGFWKFSNYETITLKSSDKEMFVAVRLILGPANIIPANTIIIHNFRGYSDSANGTLLVTNVAVIATGRPAETDENFRFRVSKALAAFTKTNFYGVHGAVTELPGVANARIGNASNGGGTTSIYIESISPQASTDLISKATSVLSETLPPWVNYSVSGPNYIGVTLVGTGSLFSQNDNTFSNKQSIIYDISSYINNFGVGAFDVLGLEDYILSRNRTLRSFTITSASIITGENDLRKYTTLDLTDDLTRIKFISYDEKLLVEPVTDAILIGLT
jgi:hypothetical protein